MLQELLLCYIWQPKTPAQNWQRKGSAAINEPILHKEEGYLAMWFNVSRYATFEVKGWQAHYTYSLIQTYMYMQIIYKKSDVLQTKINAWLRNEQNGWLFVDGAL